MVGLVYLSSLVFSAYLICQCMFDRGECFLRLVIVLGHQILSISEQLNFLALHIEFNTILGSEHSFAQYLVAAVHCSFFPLPSLIRFIV